MASGHKAAGGIHSNKKIEVAVRTGSGAHGKNPGHVGQTGIAVDPRAVEERKRPAPESRFGNEGALNVGKGGPGTGRDIHPTGAQGQHGPAVGENKPTAGGLIEGWPTLQRPKA